MKTCGYLKGTGVHLVISFSRWIHKSGPKDKYNSTHGKDLPLLTQDLLLEKKKKKE
jgi:hypothetical protein